MRKSSSYTALLRPTRLLTSEKSATYTIKWSYTIIWQVRVVKGQTNSKWFLQANVSFIKQMNKFEFTACRLVFVHFLEERSVLRLFGGKNLLILADFVNIY
jgi:hypothetical protein